MAIITLMTIHEDVIKADSDIFDKLKDRNGMKFEVGNCIQHKDHDWFGVVIGCSEEWMRHPESRNSAYYLVLWVARDEDNEKGGELAVGIVPDQVSLLEILK